MSLLVELPVAEKEHDQKKHKRFSPVAENFEGYEDRKNQRIHIRERNGSKFSLVLQYGGRTSFSLKVPDDWKTTGLAGRFQVQKI